MSTNTGLTGLQAATADINATSNNIANANTTGFKSSSTAFAAVFSSGVAGNQTGNGVQVVGTTQDFSQGGVTVTNRSLDLALQNNGFFMVRPGPNDAPSYTRAGSFSTDQNGYMVTTTGEKLQGFLAVNGAISSTVGDLQISNAPQPPKQTSTATISLNLDATQAIPTTTPFNASDSSSYNSQTTAQVIDSLGVTHTMTNYFLKTSNNNWDVHVSIDGAQIGTGSLSYNAAGTLQNSTGLSALNWTPGGGAAAQSLTVDLSSSTQYGTPTIVNNVSQDGYASGVVSGIDIDSNGVLSARYSNGQLSALGQVVVAKFNNPGGLLAAGSSGWKQTSSSGAPVVSSANSTGAIQSGALEDSNVDLSGELVRLVIAQRAFQANAQSIKAGDTVMQSILTLN